MKVEMKEPEQTLMVPFKDVTHPIAIAIAPSSLPVPVRSSVNIGLVAPNFQAKLVKEETLAEERRKAERRRIEQEQYERDRQLSRQAVFTSD